MIKDYKEKRELYGKFTGKKDHVVLNSGIGINFWIINNFGINIESQYNWVTDYSKSYADFFHHSASIVYKLGESDKDKDGVPDKYDICPTVAGLSKFQGCPDSDGDNIPDINDQCPYESGPIENIGCPLTDSDRDGVPDQYDKCPQVPGFEIFNGCPDSDGDNIPDNEDVCPTERGLIENKGCPYTIDYVTRALKDILFKFNSSKLTEDSVILVEGAAKILKNPEFDEKKFYIDGHTDRVGVNAVNNKISKQRAQAVVEGLIKAGIDIERLTARGFGKTKLICTQEDVDTKYSQEECDRLNRRVEVLDQELENKVKLSGK